MRIKFYKCISWFILPSLVIVLYTGCNSDFDKIFYDTVETPVFSLPAGTYTSAQTVTISTETPGCSIKYTTDNSDPTTSGTAITGTTVIIGLNTTMTIKAYAYRSDRDNSLIIEETYVVSGTVGTPYYFPPSGKNIGTSIVSTMYCSTAGATIRYTTDDSDPITSDTALTGPTGTTVTIGAAMTIRAYAYKTDWIDSAVSQVSYTISAFNTIQENIDNTSNDTINVPTGTYTENLTLDSTTDTDITINGATGTADDVVLDGYVTFTGSTDGITFSYLKFSALTSTNPVFDISGGPHDNLSITNSHIVSDGTAGSANSVIGSNSIGNNFLFYNNTVQGFTNKDSPVLFLNNASASTVTGWRINYNTFENCCGGSAIKAYEQNGIQIIGNSIDYSTVTMDASTDAGIYVDRTIIVATPNPILIQNNTVTGPGTSWQNGDGVFSCIVIQYINDSTSDANATVSGNNISSCYRGIADNNSSGITITNNSVSSSTVGIGFSDDCNGIDINGNDIYSNTTGILLPDITESMWNVAYDNSSGGNVFNNNNIYNNNDVSTDYGFKNLSGVSTNAENNWWGDATGPDDDALVINGTGDKISTGVDADPWSLVLY